MGCGSRDDMGRERTAGNVARKNEGECREGAFNSLSRVIRCKQREEKALATL